jgi:hypothetical protein
MTIIAAILQGERDPQKLAAMVQPELKAMPDDIVKQAYQIAWLGLPTVTLFGPRIAVHVVAVLFPEAGAAPIHNLDAGQPFGALPRV